MNEQTYNDGLLTVYKTEDIGAAGRQSEIILIKKGDLRYQERTVGINRYEKALQRNVKISRVLRTQRKESVNPQDIITTGDGLFYEVDRVTHPQEVQPPSMDLSLVKVVQKFEKS